MEPEVAAALIAGGGATLGTLLGTLGSQLIAARRETARDRAQADRDERSRRWETNRERLIELRALLDTAGVTLTACENAIAELVTHGLPAGHADRAAFEATTRRINELASDLDKLEGRIALRLGTTHPITRPFTLARTALRESHLGIQRAVNEELDRVTFETVEDARPVLAQRALDEARRYRLAFFEQARQRIGPIEEEPPHETGVATSRAPSPPAHAPSEPR